MNDAHGDSFQVIFNFSPWSLDSYHCGRDWPVSKSSTNSRRYHHSPIPSNPSRFSSLTGKEVHVHPLKCVQQLLALSAVFPWHRTIRCQLAAQIMVMLGRQHKSAEAASPAFLSWQCWISKSVSRSQMKISVKSWTTTEQTIVCLRLTLIRHRHQLAINVSSSDILIISFTTTVQM